MTVYKLVKFNEGHVFMYDELLRQRIIIEFAKLVKKAKDNDDTSSYAQFMKEVILNTSGLN